MTSPSVSRPRSLALGEPYTPQADDRAKPRIPHQTEEDQTAHRSAHKDAATIALEGKTTHMSTTTAVAVQHTIVRRQLSPELSKAMSEHTRIPIECRDELRALKVLLVTPYDDGTIVIDLHGDWEEAEVTRIITRELEGLTGEVPVPDNFQFWSKKKRRKFIDERRGYVSSVAAQTLAWHIEKHMRRNGARTVAVQPSHTKPTATLPSPQLEAHVPEQAAVGPIAVEGTAATQFAKSPTIEKPTKPALPNAAASLSSWDLI